MPVKLRIVKSRRKRADQVPRAARWWLQNGCTCEGNNHDTWQVSALHFDRPVAAGSTFWTRADLRELGYGPRIDQLIATGRCPPDAWRDAR